MKTLVLFALCLAGALARPNDIIDIEQDNMEHEQEGQAGQAVEGEYSWVAPDGEEYVVKYKADHMGYRVIDSNVVPEVLEVEVPQVRAVVVEEPVEANVEEDEDIARIVAGEVVPAEGGGAKEGPAPEKNPEEGEDMIILPGEKAGQETPAEEDPEGAENPAGDSPPAIRVVDSPGGEEEGIEEGSPETRATDLEEEAEDDEEGDARPRSFDHILEAEENEDEDDD